jgi:hypothetical protein
LKAHLERLKELDERHESLKKGLRQGWEAFVLDERHES